MKRFELIKLFANARELDGLASYRLHAERCAAASVAVELGENRAGDVQRLIEMCGDIYRLLTSSSVEDEENFLRLHQVTQADKFLHQRFINLEPAGGIEDDGVAI